MGYDPVISIEIKFPLDRARRAMEASQILCGLLENSRGQLSLARLGGVIFGRFHLVDLVCSFFSQAFEDRHFTKIRRIVEPLITRMLRMKRRFLPIRLIRTAIARNLVFLRRFENSTTN